MHHIMYSAIADFSSLIKKKMLTVIIQLFSWIYKYVQLYLHEYDILR